MPGRKYSAGTGYRYGFNGKENDNEVKGEGNQQDYGMRIYDPRIGRWFSTDSYDKPWLSSYQFGSDNPTNLVDPDGGDEIHFYYVTTTKYVMTKPLLIKGVFHEGGLKSVLVTYKMVDIIQDNNKDRFFVHRISKGKAENIEFYPNSAEPTKTGVTTSSIFLGIVTVKDNDSESLKKIQDDFPGLEQIVAGPEFYALDSHSQHKANHDWWIKFYSDLHAQKEQEALQDQANKLMLGIVIGAATDFVFGEIASAIVDLAGSNRNIIQDIFQIKILKGNTEIAAGTEAEAMTIGKAWVNGEKVTNIKIKNGIGFTDGTRTFRLQWKPKDRMWKANFEENTVSATGQISNVKNVHMNITDKVASPE